MTTPSTDATPPALKAASEGFLDGIFGPGMGARHTAFVERLGEPTLRDGLHRYHVLESDERWLSIEDNYLLGMTVLCATGDFAPASMFAMTLMHRDVPKERTFAAVARLEMWVGGIRAATALGHMRKAVRSYEKHGMAAMAGWFPEPAGSAP